MQPQINQIRESFEKDIANCLTEQQLEQVRVKHLGRKQGLINNLLSKLPELDIQARRKLGPVLNNLKVEIERTISEKKKSFALAGGEEWVDITAPGRLISLGHHNPLTLILNELKDIFHYLGFTFVDGPEVETDTYNFQKLLLHPDHPARDAQQTYYLDTQILLRTHTSSMQIRYMEENKPPIRIISPGRVFRRDQIDATHLPNFMQLEGLLVDKQTNLAELIGTLKYLIKEIFGKETKVRVYGHHFPYTEPSIEIEMYHKKIKKWIEMGGAGMVHPQVLCNVNIDPNQYQGWAFGLGLERFAMIKYDIDDIRLFYSGDYRFLEQF